METRAAGLRGDIAVAGALALVLGIGWTLSDWPALARLRLPDTDDVMRLQQIRDWLGGQRFADLTQHRLGAGVPMHWSRLADLGPAALIELFAPLLSRHGAEVAAVIVWPLLLFAGALTLVARITRAVTGAGPPRIAAVVASVAYPATTVFLPGRIDHHGLQIVLLLGAVLAALGVPSWRRGGVLGLLAASGLVVGLETAPLLGVLGVVVAVEWITRGDGRRLTRLGAGALAGLVVGRAIFVTEAFAYPACDGFTASAWRAAIILAAAALALPFVGARLVHPIQRGGLAIMLGGVALASALAVSPACLAPYGAVDPLLARWWLAKVGEAQPLFDAPPATAIGYAGVMAAGIAAALWRARDGTRGWAVLLAVLLAAFAITLSQLRGAYAGAMLAAPALGSLIVGARQRGTLPLVGAWLGSTGLLYPIAAGALTPAPVALATRGSCDSVAVMDRLAQLPPGVLMAPIDTGAWAIAATRHRAVAGPYHRNNAGNLAMYRLFSGSAAQARAVARRWRVDYVLICNEEAAAPRWLRPLPASAGVRLYQVTR